MSVEIDLFGNPVRKGFGRRGRPPYGVTERNRNKVKLLLALGWSAERIANALQVSKATLYRYFGDEMAARDAMRDRLDAERAMVLAEQAGSGNIGAHRQLQAFIDRNDRMQAERELAEAPKEKQVGVKEAARMKARDAEDLLAEELALEAGRNPGATQH